MMLGCREPAGGGGGSGFEQRQRSGLHQVQQGSQAIHV